MVKDKLPKNASAATVTTGNSVKYEWEYARPIDNRTKWEKIKQGIWNSETHQFLGRTWKSWGGIIIFYLIFYGALAMLFALCMKGLMATIDEKYPSYQLESSIIGTNPGMGFRPMAEEVEKGSLIWYVANNNSNVKRWVKTLDTYLELYNDSQRLPGRGYNQMICDYDRPPKPGKVCAVIINSRAWGPCIHNNNYSYPSASPCVFLKLNRIYGWEPEFYNDIKTLPEEMPDELKSHIANITDKKELNNIWVSCHGEAPADRENIGELKIYPQPGFPGYYYPYINTEGYLSPLIAVHFRRPAMHRLINIECRAWAKNIHYRRSLQNREGSVHFELLID